MAEYLDWAGLQRFWTNKIKVLINTVKTNLDNSKLNTSVSITWSALKALRDAGTLVPGQSYRITDYTCTVNSSITYATSAGNLFDIIVIADDTSHLNENARCCHHSGDTYFADSKVEAWKIKYCIDNDTTRFEWANTTNGKGVIYWMKDEWGNETPYDFKNVQFYRKWNSTKELWCDGATSSDGVAAFTFSSTGDSESWRFTDYSLEGDTREIYGNIIKEDLLGAKIRLNRTCFFGSNCNRNFLSFDCYSCTFSLNCTLNFLDSFCYGNTFGTGCSGNHFGILCQDNTLGSGCEGILFESYCQDNILGSNCSSIFLGLSCNNNTFGSNCQDNTFGSLCRNNTFGSRCSYNAFASDCQNNTFASGCSFNTFDSSCKNNTLGIGCLRNIFGSGCYNNTFGSGCQENTFGPLCQNNNFGSDCCYNVFGSGCVYNTFGFECSNNTFGSECSIISFASTSTGTPGDYFQNIKLESRVQYCIFYNTDSTSYSYVQNILVKSSIKGDEEAGIKTVVNVQRNLSYDTTIAMNSSGVIKTYCEADLIA